jgi:glucan phosphoethanolaminetransferase (alkaline phosphatase superfamily)
LKPDETRRPAEQSPAQPRKEQPVATACAWWCALGLLTLALGALAPGGFFHTPHAVALACAELAALAVLVALAAAAGRLVGRRIRIVAASAVLLAFGASWGTFWYTGHFLDGESIGFLFGDLAGVLGYAAGMNVALFAALGAVTITAAVAATRLLPRWVAARPPAFLRSFTRITISAAAACAVTTLLHAGTGEYRAQRDFAAGPSARALSDLLESPDGPQGAAAAPVSRRPIAPAEFPVESRPLNVLVILVDSLRADQLRTFGGARDVMPAVDALAREGIAYTDCLTTATHTDYAAPSALSSHHPLRARTSHTCPANPPYPRILLHDILKAAGWRTAIFSSQDEHWRSMANYLDTGSLDRYVHAGAGPRPENPEGTLDDSVTTDAATRWIDEGGAPFFACLNLQNAHAPYPVPAGFARRFGPATRDFPISFGWYPREKTEVVKDLYADSLAYIDLLLGRLFDHLKERGLWDETIVIVTADHGEAFYERGIAMHGGAIVPEVARVPLIVRVPGLAPARDARPAQILDIPPTVCRALGMPPHPSFQGIDLLESHPPRERSRFIVVQTPFARQCAIDRGGRTLIYDAHAHAFTSSDPDLEARLVAWYRAQVDYYADHARMAAEYPPILE